MRFFLTFLIWIVIVGGLYVYVSKRDAARETTQSTVVQSQIVEQQFSFELTPTFSMEKDPFALQTDGAASSGIEVRLNGKIIEMGERMVGRGEILRVDSVIGILPGHNEVYVKATPPMAESGLEHGVRLKVLEGKQLVVDKTLWSSDGALVSGTVFFEFMATTEEGKHDR